MKYLLIVLLVVASIGCKSKREKLANSFVKSLNADMNYNVSVHKLNTDQANFILVKDKDTGQVDAYSLANYKKGSSAIEHIENPSTGVYKDLDFAYTREHQHTGYTTRLEYEFVGYEYVEYYEPGYYDEYGDYYEGYYYGDWEDEYDYVTYYDYYDYSTYESMYEDYNSGLLFSKTKMSTSDLTKAAEIVDALRLKSAQKQLTVQFGLAPKRAKEVAGLAIQLGKNDKKVSMTKYQYDQYSKAILGSTYDEIQGALDESLTGDEKQMDKVFTKAAKVNGISKKSVKKLADLFIKN